MNHVKHVIPMSDSSVSIKPEDIQPTVLPDAFIQSDIVRKLNTLSLPRYDQLPILLDWTLFARSHAHAVADNEPMHFGIV